MNCNPCFLGPKDYRNCTIWVGTHKFSYNNASRYVPLQLQLPLPLPMKVPSSSKEAFVARNSMSYYTGEYGEYCRINTHIVQEFVHIDGEYWSLIDYPIDKVEYS